jgi:hypothetical protein
VFYYYCGKKNTREGFCKYYLATAKTKQLIETFASYVFMLNKGKMDLRVRNEAGVAELTLLSGLILELDNYYFVLALSRNIISISE